LPVLDPGRGRTKTGQLWAYAADDRPWGGSDPPGVAYVYASDRKAERPITHLDGFKGVLQVDGYAGYRRLAERGDVQLAFCWVHVWRNFYKLATPGPAPIASEALQRIAALYAIEKDKRVGLTMPRSLAVNEQTSSDRADWSERSACIFVTLDRTGGAPSRRSRGQWDDQAAGCATPMITSRSAVSVLPWFPARAARRSRPVSGRVSC
jgi:hypothetical protein